MKKHDHLDLILITLALLVLNAPLLLGGSTAHLAYSATRVADGEWWRLVTHPFVHVSTYHFALDAIGFLCLYAALPMRSATSRMACVTTCAASSLLIAILFSPDIATSGLRGLSGPAHGLMALTGLMMWQDARGSKADHIAGAAAFVVVAGKAMLECATGQVFLSSWHIGSIGLPIVQTHAGGVLGGLLVFATRDITAEHAPHHRHCDTVTA